MNVTCAASFTSYMAGSVGMLYHLLDCDVIPMSGLQCYTYVWFANLYLCPDWNVISMSGLQIYAYFCYTIFYLLLFLANLISDLLYLLLVCIFIPMSVISNSGFLNFTGYGIVCYIIFCAPHPKPLKSKLMDILAWRKIAYRYSWHWVNFLF